MRKQCISTNRYGLKNINAKYGLDQPMYLQMINYVWGVVTDFDFGPSFRYRDRTVNDIIAQGFPVTLKYGSWAFVIAVLSGITLGVIAAIRQNTFIDYFAVGFSISAQVLPNFVMAPILVLIFTLLINQTHAKESFMTLKLKDGDVLIELYEDIAPNHVRRFKKLFWRIW